MLNRSKVVKEISLLSSRLFPEISSEHTLAFDVWEKICADSTFSQRAAAAQSSFLVPGWMGNLNDVYPVALSPESYEVLAVDGSQIYPDRAMPGSGCLLINVGGVHIAYGPGTRVRFFSEPFVLLPDDLMLESDVGGFSKDLVDMKREEFELRRFIDEALREGFGRHDAFRVCLVDGSIVFWHLEAKMGEVRDHFLGSYLGYLEGLYRNAILAGGYISMPRSKELVNLIKLGLCRFTVADCISCHRDHETFPCKEVDRLLDTHVVQFYVPKYHRTTMFSSNSKIVSLYPEHLRPYFFYLNVGQEVARIEVPAWIAQKKEYVDAIATVALDQCIKGRGYPVALAEAHEQAVVKGPDRDFFYHLVCKIGIENNKRPFASQKSIKKRGMSI